MIMGLFEMFIYGVTVASAWTFLLAFLHKSDIFCSSQYIYFTFNTYILYTVCDQNS